MSECVRERVSESEFVKKNTKNTKHNLPFESGIFRCTFITAPENFNNKNNVFIF